MRRTSFIVALLCLAGLLAPARAASAQTSADLFDINTLQEIRLFVNTKDLAQLRATYQLNTRYPADMLWRTTRVRNVSIRSRGFGSRSGNKMGLLIEFDKYTTGQQFLGMTSLVLKNLNQDKSMLRERLAMGFFARMGFPASRESYARVYINGEYQGLYGLVEDVAPAYLTRVFGENKGYLYEYHWLFYFYGTDLGDIAPYKPMFEPRTHTLEPDVTLYSPFRDLFREINGPDDAVWRDRVSEYIDLNYVITYLAVESFLGEYDGFGGNYGMNNFYVYRKDGSSKLQILPWDRDNALLYADTPIFFHDDEYALLRRALSYPDLRDLFLSTLESCVQSATQDDWLAQQAASSASLINAAAHEDPRKPYTNDEFDAAVLEIKDILSQRPAQVTAQVAKARGSLGY